VYLARGGVLLEDQMTEAKRRLQQQVGNALEKAGKVEEGKEAESSSAIVRMM
jgi:hypothetical protein